MKKRSKTIDLQQLYNQQLNENVINILRQNDKEGVEGVKEIFEQYFNRLKAENMD